MSRSLKKSFFCHLGIIRNYLFLDNAIEPFKIFSRSSAITPFFSKFNVVVFSGKEFFPLRFLPLMHNHRLGEYSPTRAVYVSKVKLKKKQVKKSKKKAKSK